MKFRVLYQNEIIGISELEHGDCGIGRWVIFGKFIPSENYLKIQPICQKISESLSPIPNEKKCTDEFTESLRNQIPPSQFKVITDLNEEFNVSSLLFTDFSHLYGKDAIEIEIVPDDNVNSQIIIEKYYKGSIGE